MPLVPHAFCTHPSRRPPQVLPLVPPETTYWSPYSGLDALCGNTLLLPVEELAAMGLLEAGELPPPQPVELHADFTAVAEWKVGGCLGGGGACSRAAWGVDAQTERM